MHVRELNGREKRIRNWGWCVSGQSARIGEGLSLFCLWWRKRESQIKKGEEGVYITEKMTGFDKMLIEMGSFTRYENTLQANV